MNHKEKVPLEKQLLSAKNCKSNIKTLKESNHYNKVVVSTSKSTKTKDEQIQFRKDLNMALLSTKKTFSSYEQAIKKEIDVRSNEMRIIIVQRGDTLSKIAKKAYGDIDAYPKIFMANPEVLKNPNEIFVGQRLRIPA
ncbi:Ferric siderophore transport system, periplasmic binding protein TonB [hydrothermal vent metagenome]|uniref:Ferric siderophore transport system, periplasmic binding protein TonB n=1 Tax=hydrothermal vent metagenome TaxID=652676 RepID=A0A1W1D095_9ZZZZ